MSDDDTVMYYMGRDTREMSKEELIAACKVLLRNLNNAHEAHQSTLRLWKTYREARSA